MSTHFREPLSFNGNVKFTTRSEIIYHNSTAFAKHGDKTAKECI